MAYCIFCNNFDVSTRNESDKTCMCVLSAQRVKPLYCCPGYSSRPDDISPVTGEQRTVVVGEPVKVLQPEPDKGGHSQVVSASRHTKQHEAPREREEEELSVVLRKHQQDAREKFHDKDAGALFFEMGCGKTLTSMIIMCDKFKAGKINSLLVVAPNDVHKQWFDDLTDEGSVLRRAVAQEDVDLAVQIYGGRGGQKQFSAFDYADGKLHILCTNVDTFSTPEKWKDIVDWANLHDTAIIIDEATVIKNPSSKRSQRLLYEFNEVMRHRRSIISSKKINPVRFVLTGTPVTNGPLDLWAIMEFIEPNYFGRNYYSFTNYYGMHTRLNVQERTISVPLTEKTWHGIRGCSSYLEAYNLFGCTEDTWLTVVNQDRYSGPYKHADELKQLLEPSAVFAKLTDCVDMPPCNYIVKQVAMSDAQKKCYNEMKKELMTSYDEHTATARTKLVVNLRLQQISSGFIMAHQESFADEDVPFWDAESFDIAPDEVIWLGDTNPKLEQLMRDVDELDKPLLIITRFSAEAAKIYDLLKDKYDVCLWTGWKTVGTLEGFKKGEHDIIVANICKIARGHNLQVSHTTLYYSNSYDMELRQQSEFRTFRMGQTEPCLYVDYASCEIDNAVAESLRMKKGLLDYIRDKGGLKEVL